MTGEGSDSKDVRTGQKSMFSNGIFSKNVDIGLKSPNAK
tara:strand:- start:790 stop:906 length:117 start_codon:yes stop_codon:yes gene_type:complete